MFINSQLNRRRFIAKSAALLPVLASLPGALNAQPPAKYKMGLQLFSIRDLLARDVTGTIEKVAKIGYEDCETYGYNPAKRQYYGMPAVDFRQLLSHNKMVTTSGHYDFTTIFDKSPEAMFQFVDQCIEGAHALGQRYITWPWLDPAFRTVNHFHLLTGKLNQIGERINKAGLKFAYHHHDFEFTDHEGVNGYEIILRDTDPGFVKLQMDLYWVMHSSRLTPEQLIDKQPGRFVMWHIKDMDKKSRDYSELGNGSIDFSKILPLASRAGLEYYYIEQGGNFAVNPLQSVTDSARYFKKYLEKYLM